MPTDGKDLFTLTREAHARAQKLREQAKELRERAARLANDPIGRLLTPALDEQAQRTESEAPTEDTFATELAALKRVLGE